MQRVLVKHWPLVMSLAVLLSVTAVLLVIIGRQTHWQQFYTLDDAYIHMSMSRNFARHAVWGITSQGFTSSSSSILWTLLLAAVFRAGGDFTITPLMLNLLISAVLVIAVYVLLLGYQWNRVWIGVFLVGSIFLTSLPTMIFSGMEHLLQILIDLAFVFFAARILSDTSPGDKKRDVAALLCLTPLVPMVRYEGLFLIAVVGLLLILRKRFVIAIASGLLALLPIGLYGIISKGHGWSWLPNSVLLKGSAPDLSSIGGAIAFSQNALSLLIGAPHLLGLLMAIVGLCCYRRYHGHKCWEFGQVLSVIWIATLVLHLHFASTGRFYRYEAYLVLIGFLILGILAMDMYKTGILNKLLAVGLLLMVVPLCLRGEKALGQTPQATTNIYEQQYQMAKFLQENYSGTMVGANDIGAINYFAHIHCLDLWGLATWEVAKAKRSEQYDTQSIDEITKFRGCRIAIVYDSWFQYYGGVPRSWVKVARWDISNNVVCGDNNVSFYAVEPSEADQLEKNLQSFSGQLPKDVIQHFRADRSTAVNVGK